jgi:hypothetical protein
MSTNPFGNRVAEWFDLGTAMLAMAVNFPALGSYSSALARNCPLVLVPPVMSTLPFGNIVAV